jgi:hypothetical protein
VLNGLEREKGRLHAAGPLADGQGLLRAGWVIFGSALAAVDDMMSSAPVAIKTTALTRRTAEASSARCRYVVSAPGAAESSFFEARSRLTLVSKAKRPDRSRGLEDAGRP